MALIRSLDPERFNAETLARFMWETDGAIWADESAPLAKREYVDLIQCVLDAMVAEGILSTKEPLESGESPNVGDAIREWRRINTVPKIRATGYGPK